MSNPSIPLPDVVRAQRFELMDSAGQVRAVLGINDRANPTLRFFDARGVPRVVVGVVKSTGEPFLEMCDAAGRPRIDLLRVDTGEAGLRFFDEEVDARAVFGTGPDGRAHLVAGDRHGHEVSVWRPEPAPPPTPIPVDAVEQLLTLARGGHEADFRWFAKSQGVKEYELDALWHGTVQRLRRKPRRRDAVARADVVMATAEAAR